MKRVSQDAETLCLRLNDPEADLLRLVLGSYPMAIDGWPQSPNSPRMPSSKPDPSLLAEALRDRKLEGKAEVQKHLRDCLAPASAPGRWEWRLALERFDWVLQVINEVRVASWYRLGCPEEPGTEFPNGPDADRWRDVMRHAFAGELIASLLHCIENPPDQGE